jgi:arylsulfatase A-like enzyme
VRTAVALVLLRPVVFEPPTNVVVVIGCTVRRDQTTPYGGPDTTPFLASLAADGARFDDALSTSSWTRESIAGLLTGAPPATWGLADERTEPSPLVLVDEATTLAEHFRAGGWVTLGVTANPNVNAAFGFAQGFDHHVDAAATRGFSRANRTSGEVAVAEALALLDARTDEERARPVYLQLVLIDAHSPRDPPAEELARFAGDVPPEVQAYRATLRRLDDRLAELDRELVARGLGPEHTLLVFVADHGEGLSFPKHHLGSHGRRMYPSTVSVPWIVRGPGVEAGAVVRGLASGEDFSPTVLGLARLPDPGVPGRDWSAQVRYGGATRRTRAWSMSTYKGADVAAVWTGERQCQRDFGSRGERPMPDGCFDRAADPTFATPLAGPELLDELSAWRRARLREGATREVRDAELVEGTARELEALGYAE